jgi:DNA-binding beta-propeller fold protein YncE
MRALLIVCALFANVNLRAVEPLQLETELPLGSVVGRIDHLAIDLARQRLFVAELGNNSVDVIDLRAAKPLKRLTGFNEPQGVGYAAGADTLFVASAGDGSVRMFQGSHLSPVGQIALGSDADNIHADAAGKRVYIGYGDGAIAVIDAASRTKLADIALPAHPEGFQLDATAKRLFVNLPEAHSIASVDLSTARIETRFATHNPGANFPLAIDAQHQRVLVVFRNPSQLVTYALRDGAKETQVAVCNDADDVFVDARRQRAYISCGEGYLDVFAMRDEKLERIAHLPTTPGARTALFVPELDRLYLGVRASTTQAAAVWVFRPTDPSGQ